MFRMSQNAYSHNKSHLKEKEKNGDRMIIKHKINFFVGIWCGLCFVVSATIGRDLFVLGFDAFAAIINFACAFVEGERK